MANKIKIDSSNFFESGTILKLHFRQFGATKNIEDDVVEEKGFDSETVKAVKSLFTKEDKELFLDCFKTLKNKTNNEIKRYSIAVGIPGLRFIPNKTVEGLIEILQEKKALFENLKTNFLDQYEDMIEKAKNKPLFKLEDYPSKLEMESRFNFGWSIYQFDPPSNLPEEIVEVEKKKAQENAERAIKRFLSDMLKEISDKINKFSKRFDDRKITQKALKPLKEFLLKMTESFEEYFDESTDVIVNKLNKILVETDLDFITGLEGEEKVKAEFEVVEKLERVKRLIEF